MGFFFIFYFFRLESGKLKIERMSEIEGAISQKGQLSHLAHY